MTASHEIGEWMNDPLLTNQTPSWGNEGEFKSGSCSIALEVGDSVNGIKVPITLSGVVYNVQELAFFSWFFNPGFFSYGAGGKFSSNGTFKGPSKSCPTGGTN